MSPKNSSTGPANIKSFEITSNSGGGSKDISAGVVEYSYYESVLTNNVTATAVVIESGADESGPSPGVLDSLPIRGGEKSKIIVEDTQGNQLQFPGDLYVNRVRDGDPGSFQDLYMIDFVSIDHFLNNQTRVVKRYEGNISDNVNKILQEVLGTSQIGKVDDTALEFNFNGNRKKPFYTCTWLASKAVPPKGIGKVGGYLFYQTREGFQFRAIDQLFQQSSTKRFIYNETQVLPQGYDEKVISYNISADTDMNKNMNIGAYSNNAIFFDFVKMEYKSIDFGIEEQEGEAGTAGRDYIFVNRQFIEKEKPSRLFSIIKDIGVNPKGTGQEQLSNWKQQPEEENYQSEKTLVQTIMRYNQLFTVQTNIIIPGDFTIKAGDIVECDFPQIEGQLKKENNPQSGGKYLVASVCHRVTPRETLTSLGLVRDSFGKGGS
jgi:hypothetical protein